MAEEEQEVKQEAQSEVKKDQPKKSPWGKIIGIIVAIIIVFALINGLGGGSSKTEYSKTKTEKVGNLQYNLVDAKRVKDDELEAGYTHLNVTMKIQNNGDEEESTSNMHFILLNGQGEQQDQDMPFFQDDTHMTSNDEIAPGTSIERTVTWKIKEDAKGLRVRYYENIINSKINDYTFEWAVD